VPRESFKHVEPVHVRRLVEHKKPELTRSNDISGSAFGANPLIAGNRDPSAPANVGDPFLIGTVRSEVSIEVREARSTDEF
jgi:hypothetical protein